jgi:O-methyltransferase involved in polyketide biosynthesis
MRYLRLFTIFVFTHLLARTRAIDDTVRAALQQGARQVVILEGVSFYLPEPDEPRLFTLWRRNPLRAPPSSSTMNRSV